RLENLAEVGDLVARLVALESGLPAPAPVPAPAAVKKKLAPSEPEPAPAPPARADSPPPAEPARTPPAAPAPDDSPRPAEPARPLDLAEVAAAWPKVVERVGLRLGKGLSQVQPTELDGANVLVIGLSPRYNWVADECAAPDARA